MFYISKAKYYEDIHLYNVEIEYDSDYNSQNTLSTPQNLGTRLVAFGCVLLCFGNNILHPYPSGLFHW